jgi:ferric-dicitrate binding protein FerR (iron transport regulator)
MPQRIRNLLARELLGIITQEEKLELDAWLHASPDNARLKREHLSKERIMEAMTDLSTLNSERIWKQVEKHMNSQKVHALDSQPNLRSTLRKVAAVLLPLIAVGIWYFWFRKKEMDIYQWTQEMANQLAESRSPHGKAVLFLGSDEPMKLEDIGIDQSLRKNGFQVTRLASKTISIRVDPGWSEGKWKPDKAIVSVPYGQSWKVSIPNVVNMEVGPGTSVALLPPIPKLTSLALDGRAHFDVVPNPRTSFLVATRAMKTETLGTSFDVYSDDTISTAVLLSGAIMVSNDAAKITLRPGEEAKVTSIMDRQIRVSDNIDTGQSTAWRRPYFDFNNVTIKQLMQQVTLWYGMDGTIFHPKVDTVTRGLMGGGHIDKDHTLRELLGLLQRENRLLFEVRGKKIYVSPDL